MAPSLSKMLSSLSGSKPSYPNPQVSQVLICRPSPHDENTTLIERSTPTGTVPLFSVTSEKKTKEVVVYRVGTDNGPLQPTVVATSKYSSLSGSTRISMMGREIKMKESNSVTGFKFDWPPMGSMKWDHKGAMKELTLKDGNGQALAKYVTSVGFAGAGGSRFDILVPGDDYLLDLVVVTGIAAAKATSITKATMKAAMDVAGGFS